MSDLSSPSRSGSAAPLGVGVAPRRQRRWSLALVAALVVLGTALAFAVLWMNAGDRKPVLALARGVDAGEVITGADLEVVRVAADPGIELIPADQRDTVIGQSALTDLVVGSLLTDGQLGEGTTLDEGFAVVGVNVDAGKMPTPDLRTGNRVSIIQTGSAAGVAVDAGDEADSEASVIASQVLGVEIAVGTVQGIELSDESSGGILVSVLVEEPLAARIAGASAAGEASLVLIP